MSRDRIYYYCEDIENVVSAVDGVLPGNAAAFATLPPRATLEGWQNDGTPATLAILFSGSGNVDGSLFDMVRAAVVEKCDIFPTQMRCIPPDAFARTDIGKLQHNVMRQRLERGEYNDCTGVGGQCITPDAWTTNSNGCVSEHKVATAKLETDIACIFEEVLGLKRPEIPGSFHFFLCGGSSHDMLRAGKLLHQQFESHVPRSDIRTIVAKYPTVAQLARYILAREQAGSDLVDD